MLQSQSAPDYTSALYVIAEALWKPMKALFDKRWQFSHFRLPHSSKATATQHVQVQMLNLLPGVVALINY